MERVLAVIKLTEDVPLLSRIVNQRRNPLEMGVAAFQRGDQAIAIRGNVTVAIIVKSCESQAVVAPTRAEWINRKAPHKLFRVRLFDVVEVAVVERAEVVIDVCCFASIKFYRPL